ncbi:MAG TPA: tRNA (adenosine(37)-N6)-threonylcarbamoyltransferase complex transferase subunit TsaD [Candidatus Acidoferrales bacterium]|nr:tRNA (adenosine(37)-N6)-threonylcarbamoyltransferase complex transferase subunit TsaD [Candidatus Acidoferrales bacterium]
MLVLGVETSCDDTAAAVVTSGRKIVSSLVSSQDAIHRPFGGVVPELASRQHIRQILPMIEGALQKAGVGLGDIDGMAVTYGPGLVGSLLVGLSTVKAIAYRRRIPYVGVNHLEGHLLAILLERDIDFPYLSLLASGGHTLLYIVKAVGEYQYLGGTRDDAAGEAYDKAAKLMGLGYPGGRVIDELAKQGDPRALRFPRARLKGGRYDFSFSGLKTSLWHYLQSAGREKWEATKADIAASFQEAVVDMLIAPTLRAARDYQVKRVVLAGGVSANSRLRQKMTEAAAEEGLELYYSKPALCTDNAAMIALTGSYKLARGLQDDFALNADADLTL